MLYKIKIIWYNLYYLEKEDHTMPTKQVNLRIDEGLLHCLEDRATREHRTLSNMIISILLDAMEQGCSKGYNLKQKGEK